MNHKIRDEMKRFFYHKDYDSKIGKNSDVLADEMYAWMAHMFEPEKPKDLPKAETVTIGGIKYTLEEIKK